MFRQGMALEIRDEWSEGELSAFTVRSLLGNPLKMVYGDEFIEEQATAGEEKRG
jgi:hypothetical protein